MGFSAEFDGFSSPDSDIFLANQSLRELAHQASQWELEVMQERLMGAPDLAELQTIPPDATLQLYVRPPAGQAAAAPLVFRKSPAPSLRGAETEWLQLLADGATRPVILYGACIPGGAITARDTVKAGAGFIYYEVATFRSRQQDMWGRGQALPEEIDPYILEACVAMGWVVEGLDGRKYWQLPSAYYETGPVLHAQWNTPGTGYSR